MMFGATVVWDEEAARVRNVRLALGDAFIQIDDQPPKAPRGGAVHHLGIETDDLDALVSRMKERGLHFRNPIRDEPKFRYVMVSGPDDLLMEVLQCLSRIAGRLNARETLMTPNRSVNADAPPAALRAGRESPVTVVR